MRSLCIIAALSIVMASCQRDMSTITGKIASSDGRPFPLAHVHLTEATRLVAGSPEPMLVTEQVQEDGQFSISTRQTGPFVLLCTAVGHKEFRLPLPIETHTDMTVDVQLACAVPDTAQSEIPISTTIDGGATFQQAFLVRQVDGTYRADLASIGDSVMYMVVPGITNPGATTLLGATADRYELAFMNEYASILPVVDGHVRIEYRVPGHPVVTQASYQFHDATSTQAAFAQMHEAFVRSLASSDSSLQRHILDGKSFGSFRYPWLVSADSLARAAAFAPKGLLKDEMALEAVECYLRANIPFGDDRMRALVARIPPTSLAWVYHGTLALATQRIPETGGEYFASIVDRHPWRPYAAWLLFYQCAGAHQARDESTVKVILARLTKEFGNTFVTRQAEMFAPRDVIRIGSPLPEFAFPSADDSTKVFTNAEFRGQYLLVIFWSTRCAPCVAEMHTLHRMFDKYVKTGLRMLSVTLNSKFDEINRFRKLRWPMPWSVAFVSEVGVPSVLIRFAAANPKHFLVDPKGNVLMIDSLLYGNQLDSTLAHLLVDNGQQAH
jgi:peroxiredoxin